MEFAKKLLGLALDKGAEQAEVYIRTSKNLGIDVKDGKIDTLETSFTAGFSLRVIRDRRPGFSYSSDPADINAVAERALESAGYMEPDEHAGLPGYINEPPSKVEIYDGRIAGLPEEEAIGYALLIERSARREDRRIVKSRKASAYFSRGDTYIVNSLGIDAHYMSTGCSAQITAIAEEAGESQMGWDYAGSRFLEDVGFEQVGINAARRAVQQLGARKIMPVRGFVLLDNSIACDFLGILASALSSDSVQKKKSMLAGKQGEQVLSRRLNIIDSGLLRGKLGSKPVDAEGVPTTHKVLIGEGALKGFLYNTYTAKKEGIRSTGNAARGGYTGLPAVGPTNLYAEPSEEEHALPPGDLIKGIDRGIYVIETMGMHTANPVSGEFSVGAAGLWVENGAIKYPVKEAVISGNILAMFRNISAVGDDLRFYGNIGSPSLLIEQIDISG